MYEGRRCKENAAASVLKGREPERQLAFGVPEGALTGHAFHTYALRGPDTTFQIQHNVCGRVPYAEGTVDAVEYLVRLGPFFFPPRQRPVLSLH